ncbi:hypothetical protein DMH18_26410 [Streptomyces sp. WAC 06783]|uniref:hypothetical protein n=1 Tax=Streptomyces sp. WAC 06783 TaxID=2203211 RepID=UPI000F73F1F4|nr:hypothetical protein [Streptomyces sp. WAC 06783]RSO06980.1 hypothetical protein DMH18_26410 [Streptomyces sp. WAC 06783]
MPSSSTTSAAHKSLNSLDHRVELATGHSINRLWKLRDRNLLDEPAARVADAHRKLNDATTHLTFHRVLLERLASGEFEIDQALLARIDRTVEQLKEATTARDSRHAEVLAALEPLEQAGRPTASGSVPALSAADQAALMAISEGAQLREHLLTGRLSAVTASGTRVPAATYQRLEAAGCVTRDDSHALHAGQPITVTDAGRTALASARATTRPAPPPAQRVGAWPATRPHR